MSRMTVVLGAVAALFAGMAPAQALAQSVTVKTESGPVTGVAEGKANVFRNIPYAAAPVGALRWAPPAPVKPWSAPRPAAEPGPSCPQPMTADGSPNSGGANGPVSEDCLQLNVYAPASAKPGGMALLSGRNKPGVQENVARFSEMTLLQSGVFSSGFCNCCAS